MLSFYYPISCYLLFSLLLSFLIKENCTLYDCQNCMIHHNLPNIVNKYRLEIGLCMIFRKKIYNPLHCIEEKSAYTQKKQICGFFYEPGISFFFEDCSINLFQSFFQFAQIEINNSPFYERIHSVIDVMVDFIHGFIAQNPAFLTGFAESPIKQEFCNISIKFI